MAGWRGAKANAKQRPAFAGRSTAFAINLCRLFATDLFAAILLVLGLPFLSAVALVWLERLGDRKLGKIAAIRAAA